MFSMVVTLLLFAFGWASAVEDTFNYIPVFSESTEITGKNTLKSVLPVGRELGGKSLHPDYVLFQKCRDSGEAYSASYLITREHLEYQFTDYNLTWVNCEMGSFIMMNGRANPDRNINGSLLQSVDLLDFSVVHLSTYERLLRRWAASVRTDPGAKAGNVDPIVASAKMLKERALTLRNPALPAAHPAYNRTVVIMPFLGSDMGAGHSKLSNRLQYLSACFWSFYAVYPYVVAAVKHEKDREFAR